MPDFFVEDLFSEARGGDKGVGIEILKTFQGSLQRAEKSSNRVFLNDDRRQEHSHTYIYFEVGLYCREDKGGRPRGSYNSTAVLCCSSRIPDKCEREISGTKGRFWLADRHDTCRDSWNEKRFEKREQQLREKEMQRSTLRDANRSRNI